jgi:hypothetical protein
VNNLQNSENLNFEKVWLLFQETDRKFQETDKKFQETKQLLEHTSLETDKKLQETDRQMKNLMKKMSESESRWGKFVEALAEGSIIKLLRARNINVNTTSLREKTFFNNRWYEIDIIAKNGNEVVAVEVKTTLKPDDVKEFIEELSVFQEVFPSYAKNKLYGGVAYINAEGASEVFAEKSGLFVIKAVGEHARIINKKDFEPRIWKIESSDL